MTVIVGRKGGRKGFTALLKFESYKEARGYIKTKARCFGMKLSIVIPST